MEDRPTVLVDPTGTYFDNNTCSEDGCWVWGEPPCEYGGLYEPELCPGTTGVNDEGDVIYANNRGGVDRPGGPPDTSGDIAPSEEITPKPPTVTEGDTPTIQVDTTATISSPSSVASVSVSEGISVRWPANAEGMGDLLGEPGRSVTDRPNTPGRGQMVWEIRSDPRMRIVGEQHPYIDEPWHWHVDPGHYRGYPGTPMPDWLVKILTELGYL